MTLRPLDQSLVGHETEPRTETITAEAVRRWVDAIGDDSPLYRDEAAARAAGHPAIPAPPTFVVRFLIPFGEVGLDPERMQVLHGEQEYTYSRVLHVGDTLVVRHRVASLRQSPRAGGMSLLTVEQIVEAANEGRVATGKSMLIVRDAPPGAAAASGGAGGGKASATPDGDRIPPLTKRVTQGQIDAYAEASGDHNPIHLDPERARAVGLDGTIAHGMLGMAFLGQVATDWLGAQPASGGYVARLRARFQGMVRPGDALTCGGVLGAQTDGRRRLDLWIENQRGERVITGEADVAPRGA